MRSSTSSSEHSAALVGRDPAWGRVWRVALVLFLAAGAALEVASRARGFRPTVRDDPATWAAARREVAPDSVVFTGTSRVQAAIDPGAWAAAWDGSRPVQLAVAGDSPLPIVEELAATDAFRGLLVIEVLPRIVFDARDSREIEARRMLDEHTRTLASPSRRAESRLDILLASGLAFRSLPPGQLVRRLMAAKPRLPYFSMDASRFLRLDFERSDLERRRKTLIQQIEAFEASSDAERDAVVDRLLEAESALLARGALVVLLRMPRADRVAEIEEQSFPAKRFWDPILARSRSVVIDSEREPDLSTFRCPDGSHLDVREAPAYTRALARVLEHRVASFRGGPDQGS